jgi:hypothetical protein
MIRTMAALLVLALCGCNITDDRDALRGQDNPCALAEAKVSGSILTAAPQEPVSGDLRVRGEATHEAGLAIRRITVAGIVAENNGFNFEFWSVLIPLERLRELRTASNEVQLEARAFDACGNQFSLGMLKFQVAPP